MNISTLNQDLQPYFAQLRFFPNRNGSSERVDRLLVPGNRAHDVYLRKALVFDDLVALKNLKERGVHSVQKAADESCEVMSAASHIFAPVDIAVPKLVAFRFHPEHNGRAPIGWLDCIMQPFETILLGPFVENAWLEILPEMQILRPEDADKELFQKILLKHCNRQDFLFWDPKVDYRRPAPGTMRDESYDNSQFAEKSNIALIPAIKDGAALKTTEGELILIPVICDPGAVVTIADAEKPILNITRTDLTFASGIQGNLGYPYTEVAARNQDAPSLAEYVSAKAGYAVEITYAEATQNYLAALNEIEQARGKSK